MGSSLFDNSSVTHMPIRDYREAMCIIDTIIVAGRGGQPDLKLVLTTAGVFYEWITKIAPR